jgi:competence ComEA-like helix-hairpin-helix protein
MSNQSRIAGQVGQEWIQSFAFVIGAGACVILCSLFVASDSLGSRGAHEIELPDRINPNEALVGSLVRLPGIGMGRAWAIVSYREAAFREGKRPAFGNSSDLQDVRGIGPKTVEKIGEWLEFE